MNARNPQLAPMMMSDPSSANSTNKIYRKIAKQQNGIFIEKLSMGQALVLLLPRKLFSFQSLSTLLIRERRERRCCVFGVSRDMGLSELYDESARKCF